MKEYLCKCNNCGSIMYDKNPQTNSKKIKTTTINKEILPMELLNDNGDSYYGCGNCETDEFLTDL